MALATYADLQTAIPSWLVRTGDTELANMTGDFIALAESRIYFGAEGAYPSTPLRIRAMETQASIDRKSVV